MTKAIQKVTAAQIVCKSMRKTLAVLGVLAASALVHATQTVDPALTAGGATINGSTQAVPAGSTFTFFGMYSDDSAAASESGLGLKVKYNPAHLTNLTISEEYTKCRIAAAQVQPLTANTAQAVMGWVDTSIRTAGAVGWPDLADVVGGAVTTACLNPGSINTDTAAGTSVAPGQKLFKVTATMAAGCTSAAACTSTVLFDSEGNFSYATAPAGFTNKSFTINGAAAPSCDLDVDGDGARQPFKDGIAILRYMLGIRGAALSTGITFVGPRAQVGAAVSVEQFIATGIAANAYDVDGSNTQQGFVDGIVLVRLMLGIPDSSLLTGVNLPPAATFTTAAQIRSNVNSRCGTSF